MRKENGVTLVSLVVSIMILTVLSAVAVSATMNSNILKEKNKIEEDFYDTMQNTDDTIKTEKEKWNGII